MTLQDGTKEVSRNEFRWLKNICRVAGLPAGLTGRSYKDASEKPDNRGGSPEQKK